MPRRKSRPRKERARLFKLHGGICHICEGKIHVGEKWDLEHVIPWEISYDDSDENVKPAHCKCHPGKTRTDRKVIAKVHRQEAKHYGFKASKGRPFPGGKNSKWKKKMDGSVVLR